MLGQGEALRDVIDPVLNLLPPAMGDEGTALGYFAGTEVFRVAEKDGKAVAVRLKGHGYIDGKMKDFDITEPPGTTLFSGGLRLKKKGRRTKRNGRGRKSRKLRKLATRRR
jgi:hypothetical protein